MLLLKSVTRCGKVAKSEETQQGLTPDSTKAIP